jgi:hypothetical protein
MIDLYTKVVLTVIAVALCAIVLKEPLLLGPATAQGNNCGDYRANPCYVEIGSAVKIDTSPHGLKIDTGPFGLKVQVQR